MAWTFDQSLGTDRDMVRFFIADTDSNNQLVQDEGITAILTLYGDIYEGAAALCDGLATKFARIPTVNIAGISIKGVDRADEYRRAAAQLRRQAADSASGTLGVPFIGGISKAQELIQVNDTDRMPNKFQIGQDDFPGTSIPGPTPNISDVLP